MKKGWLVFLVIFLAVAAAAAVPGQAAGADRAALLARLQPGGDPPPLFPVLTPLLLDYAESVLSRKNIATLYDSVRRPIF